jgi:hypothetical protein
VGMLCVITIKAIFPFETWSVVNYYALHTIILIMLPGGDVLLQYVLCLVPEMDVYFLKFFVVEAMFHLSKHLCQPFNIDF